jgi:predicted RNase H-like HicB family nuclease
MMVKKYINNNYIKTKGGIAMKEYVFHGIIEREGDVYCALCLELDIATESDTLEGAKKHLREAVEGYIESVVRDGEEDEFIPRPVPEEVINLFLRREVIDNLKVLLKGEKEGLQSLPIERAFTQRRLKA